MDDKLPDNVISITTLSINRSKRKHCTCDKPKYEIDAVNREVICTTCGVIVDPFDAIYEIARNWDRFYSDIKRLLEQRKEIINYKPWLLTIRNLERNYRGGKTLPCCPSCGKGIVLEEITMYTNKEIELRKREIGRGCDDAL